MFNPTVQWKRWSKALVTVTVLVSFALILLPSGAKTQEGISGQAVSETAPPGEVDSTKPPEGELAPDPIKHVEEPGKLHTCGGGLRRASDDVCL